MTTAPERRRLPVALDWIAAVLITAAIVIHLTTGVYLTIGDVRISARRDERALLLAVIVGAVRLLLDRRQGPFGVATAVWRKRRRQHVRLSDERSLLSAPGLWRRTGSHSVSYIKN